MSERIIQTIVDENGKEVLLISVGRAVKKVAYIYKDDFDFLMRLGITDSWTVVADCYVVCNGRRHTKTPAVHLKKGECSGAGRKLIVARLLKDCGVGQAIRYKDKNPLNLRRDNLTIVADKRGMRRDRDFIPQRELREAA